MFRARCGKNKYFNFHGRTWDSAPPVKNARLVARVRKSLAFQVGSVEDMMRLMHTTSVFTDKDTVVIDPDLRKLCGYCYADDVGLYNCQRCRVPLCAHCVFLAPNPYGSQLSCFCSTHAVVK